MAHDRKSAKKTTGRILADSSNAKHRFGFAGAPSTPITSAPKLSDLWFIEYKTVSGEAGVTLDVSGLAKSISHIAIMAQSQPIDQYGKRIYVPTRVDFPEVTIQMYDTVDGKMFNMAEGIYSKFFKNNDAKFSAANAEDVLTSYNSYGRKIPDGKHDYYHQNFEKITVYHFFGNLETASVHSTDYIGTGKIQKIELINPLVTSLTFSSSDYSISELRTVDMTVQPENIIISNTSQANFPAWMTLGMDYMMDELSSINKPHSDIYPDHFKDRFEEKSQEDIGPDVIAEFEDGRIKKKSQKDRLLDSKGRDVKEEIRKLDELMKLYHFTQENPNSANIDDLTKELKNNIINMNRLKHVEKDPNAPRFKTPYTPTLGSSSSYNTDFGTSMINELVSSFFGNRSFNINNTNNSFTGSVLSSLSNGASPGRLIAGAVISDGIANSKIDTSNPLSAALVKQLPDVVENIYKRGTESSFDPGVSKILKYK
jgi:hypothetical protein